MLTKEEIKNSCIELSIIPDEKTFEKIIKAAIKLGCTRDKQWGYWKNKSTFKYLLFESKSNPFNGMVFSTEMQGKNLIQISDILGEEQFQFEKGKWYCWKNTEESARQYYMKLDHIDGNDAVYSERIHANTYTTERGSWEFKGGNYCHLNECTLEEIQQYFPVIEEVKPIEKWSVGSYCVALKDKAQAIGNCEAGDIFYHGIRSWEFVNNPKDNNWCCSSDTEFNWFPTLEEAEKFSKSLLKPVKEFDLDEVTEEICQYCERNILESGTRCDSKGSRWCEWALEKYKDLNIDKSQSVKEWYKTLKKDDYVVCLKDFGSQRYANFVYKIYEDFVDCIYYFAGTNSTAIDEFRLATKEERELYEKMRKPCSIDLLFQPIKKETFEVGDVRGSKQCEVINVQWNTSSKPSKKKQVELISFDKEDIVLSTNNRVSISNKQLIIND